MMNAIIENQLIQKLTVVFQRSPHQRNLLQETDAEIIRVSPKAEMLLAITTDSIVEEITSGLYNDPYLIGWMTVMVNMSDLAAVGAPPIGILISEVFPTSYSDVSLERLQLGIRDACIECGTYVLGGDTNFGERLMLSGCAVGSLPQGHYLSRVGCQAGDVVYSTNLLGAGNAFALSRFSHPVAMQFPYRPCARLKEGQSLHGIATACMDTSDGVITTLDQLMRLNHVGFELDRSWGEALHRDAKKLAATAGIPCWLLLAGQHGEFELLFTVPRQLEEELHVKAEEIGWSPIRLGRVIDEPAIYVPFDGKRARLDTGRIRNLPHLVNGDIQSYIRELMKLNEELEKGELNHVNK